MNALADKARKQRMPHSDMHPVTWPDNTLIHWLTDAIRSSLVPLPYLYRRSNSCTVYSYFIKPAMEYCITVCHTSSSIMQHVTGLLQLSLHSAHAAVL